MKRSLSPVCAVAFLCCLIRVADANPELPEQNKLVFRSSLNAEFQILYITETTALVRRFGPTFDNPVATYHYELVKAKYAGEPDEEYSSGDLVVKRLLAKVESIEVGEGAITCFSSSPGGESAKVILGDDRVETKKIAPTKGIMVELFFSKVLAGKIVK